MCLCVCVWSNWKMVVFSRRTTLFYAHASPQRSSHKQKPQYALRERKRRRRAQLINLNTHIMLAYEWIFFELHWRIIKEWAYKSLGECSSESLFEKIFAYSQCRNGFRARIYACALCVCVYMTNVENSRVIGSQVCSTIIAQSVKYCKRGLVFSHVSQRSAAVLMRQ